MVGFVGSYLLPIFVNVYKNALHYGIWIRIRKLISSADPNLGPNPQYFFELRSRLLKERNLDQNLESS